jgi:hypothetical protein
MPSFILVFWSRSFFELMTFSLLEITQQKPMWLVEVLTGWARRAVGR